MKNLNELAVQAKEGNKEAYEEILRYFMPYIERESNKIWYRINDETAFEAACYYQLDKTIEAYEPTKGMCFKSLVVRNIYRTKASFLRRRTGKRDGLLSIEGVTEAGEMDVEKTEILKDTTNLEELVLSEGAVIDIIEKHAKNEKQRYILLSYAVHGGQITDTDIAEMMEEKFGGKKKTHIQYIYRFKEKMRKELSSYLM